MKLIKCIVRTDQVADAAEALEVLGVTGVTVTEVRGRGLRTRPTATYRGAAYDEFLAMSMIDVIADDDLVADIVRVVMDHARTGRFGDGRVIVLPVEESYSIRTRQALFA
jgi:nitrogen regulatory protein P-II 1